MRELTRKLPEDLLGHYQESFDLFEKVSSQKKSDSDKIYSLYEPQIYCVAKVKIINLMNTAIVSISQGGIILSAVSHATNIYDGATLSEVLQKAHEVKENIIEKAVCDRGYRGKSVIYGVSIILPKAPLKRDTCFQRDKKRKLCRQRAAIEPLIGHLKQHYRLSRNFLKGTQEYDINLLMSACAWNLKKWINRLLDARWILWWQRMMC